MSKERRITPTHASLLLACLTSLGCQGQPDVAPNTALAIGTASIDGKPITGGIIAIVSVEDPRRQASGMIRPDGTFRVAGSAIGENYVTVDTSMIQQRFPEDYMPVPRKCMHVHTTDLRVDLEPGENTDIMIDCKS